MIVIVTPLGTEIIIPQSVEPAAESVGIDIVIDADTFSAAHIELV